MNIVEIKDKVQNHFLDEKAFRIFYILSLFLASLCFFEHGFQVITGICMVWAVFLIKNRFAGQSGIRNIRYLIWLTLFIGSGIITSILYIQDNFGMNMLFMYHATICFFLLYGIHAQEDKESIREEILIIFKWITILSIVLAVIGMALFFVFVKIEAFGYVVGLFKNRFTGIYTHPNIAAFTSAAGIVCSHMIYYVKKEDGTGYVNHKLIKIGYLLHVATILLSDSNASLLFIVVYVSVNLLFKGKKIEEAKKVKHIVKIALLCMATVVISLGLRGVAQNGMAFFINAVHSAETEGEQIVYTPSEAEEVVEIELGRGEQRDLSSGRLDSFQKAFTLLQMKPFMGIGKENIVEYGERYLTEGFRYFDLHNGYLTILLSCGIVGFCIFAVFTIKVVGKVWNCLLRMDEWSAVEQRFFVNCLAAVASYCLYAMFERTLLFDITFMVVIFWLLLGYLMAFVVKKEEEVGEGALEEVLFKRRILIPVPVRLWMTLYLVSVTVMGFLIL